MRRSGFLSIVITSLIVLASGSNPPTALAQNPEPRRTAPETLNRSETPAPPSAAAVARGRYIVENVSVCWRCHSPVDSTGARDHSRWLMGGQVGMQSTIPGTDWAIVAPRLAGTPPGTDEEFVHLLMTGISRRGTYLRPPMPQFRMNQEDAEAVLAYLKSLGGGHLMTAVR